MDPDTRAREFLSVSSGNLAWVTSEHQNVIFGNIVPLINQFAQVCVNLVFYLFQMLIVAAK